MILPEVEFRPAGRKFSEDLVPFLSAHAFQPYNDPGQVTQILHQFISDEECIFDVFFRGTRKAFGFLIDGDENLIKSAELAIVAFSSSENDSVVLKALFDRAEDLARKKGFKAVTYSYWEKAPFAAEFFAGQGYGPLYESIEIEGTREQGDQVLRELATPETHLKWQDLTPEFERVTYDIYRSAFHGRFEVRFPDFEKFVFLARQSHIPIRILMDGDQVAAFLWVGLMADNKGEIDQVGRNPKYKGKGLGFMILHECIRILNEYQANGYGGTVEVKNEAAINVYRRYTRIVTRYTTYAKTL